MQTSSGLGNCSIFCREPQDMVEKAENQFLQGVEDRRKRNIMIIKTKIKDIFI
jgi:hypothetical protein